jgi:putative PIN family toxin of toxin-antitoxin system
LAQQLVELRLTSAVVLVDRGLREAGQHHDASSVSTLTQAASSVERESTIIDSTGAIILRMTTVVLDTNVLVAALLRGGGSARAVLRACLREQYRPVLGPALLAEYEDVLGRAELFADSVLTTKERGELFDGFLNRCRWVEVFYAWRPNLPDEADNHLIELGVAAQADAIVTRNLRDVARGELKFPSLRVLTPEQCLEAFPCLP